MPMALECERGNDPLAGNGEKGGAQEKAVKSGPDTEEGRDIHLNFPSISFARKEGQQIILEREWKGRGGEENRRAARRG